VFDTGLALPGFFVVPLYAKSIIVLVLFSVVLQRAALPLLFFAGRLREGIRVGSLVLWMLDR
jgi:hypothetical protein